MTNWNTARVRQTCTSLIPNFLLYCVTTMCNRASRNHFHTAAATAPPLSSYRRCFITLSRRTPTRRAESLTSSASRARRNDPDDD